MNDLLHVETVPQPAQAVRLTADNIGDVAIWCGASGYDKRVHLKSDRVRVVFHIPGQMDSEIALGGYMVRTYDYEMNRARYLGYSEDDYEKEFRTRSE